MFGHAKQPYLILPGCPKLKSIPLSLPALVVLNIYLPPSGLNSAKIMMKLEKKVKIQLPAKGTDRGKRIQNRLSRAYR
jgi:hypothetical protein